MFTETIPDPPGPVQSNALESRPRLEPPKLVPVSYIPVQPARNPVQNHFPPEPVANIYPPRAANPTPVAKVQLPPTDPGKFKKRVRKVMPQTRVRKPTQPRAAVAPQQRMPVLTPFNAYAVYPEQYPQDPAPPVLQPSTEKSYIEL